MRLLLQLLLLRCLPLLPLTMLPLLLLLAHNASFHVYTYDAVAWP